MEFPDRHLNKLAAQINELARFSRLHDHHHGRLGRLGVRLRLNWILPDDYDDNDALLDLNHHYGSSALFSTRPPARRTSSARLQQVQSHDPRTSTEQPMCQAAYFNLFDDFCIWGPSEPERGVANTEGEMVAWCSKPGHSTRLIPQGALTGLQWIQTPDYVQAVGFIDQPSINIKADDWEERWTPHSADLRGSLSGTTLSNLLSFATTVLPRSVRSISPHFLSFPSRLTHLLFDLISILPQRFRVVAASASRLATPLDPTPLTTASTSSVALAVTTTSPTLLRMASSSTARVVIQ
ncbi:hypothetical protein D9613_007353 [Agrocybe pediades]|uniref:Uncharacterized protein n=1 Tax=Agrocybe pediades TaxID=84607 RepID=A0A8H4VIF7_9AGAR|nr:hypothetical protein D9613_007353 [Agrocybe pediades]